MGFARRSKGANAHQTLTRSTVDKGIIRNLIHKTVESHLASMEGTLLDVGTGNSPYRRLIMSKSDVSKYIGMELEGCDYFSITPDITWDGRSIPLGSASIDIALATEVLEHCPDPPLVLDEIH